MKKVAFPCYQTREIWIEINLKYYVKITYLILLLISDKKINSKMSL